MALIAPVGQYRFYVKVVIDLLWQLSIGIFDIWRNRCAASAKKK
jgi:hypothetical protein